MFKKIAFFALFLAVTGLFAATSVNAQRLVKGSLVKSAGTTSDTLLEPVPEAVGFTPAQCANGGVGKDPEDCGFVDDVSTTGSARNWEKGNMNGSKAHYPEGSNIHYQYQFTGLSGNTTYTFRLAYDAWEGTYVAGSTEHTIDYINTYDRGVDGAPLDGYRVNPCGGVAGCVLADGVQWQIPPDTTFAGATQPAYDRFFTGWGIYGTASGFPPTAQFLVPSNPLAGERIYEITFRTLPGVTTAVVAWSGHIADSDEWDSITAGDSGAGTQQGSPYHMRNAGNGSFGNGQQELQLQASAVIPIVTAADATVAGRVLDPYGRAVSSAKLVLTDVITGEVKTAYTNTFGYYKFEGAQAGDFFVMTVTHRRYLFVNGSVSFSLEDSIEGLNFQASR